MTSLFAWMDHSEAERRRTLDIVALFRDHTTRDELGIGTVRDAFADLFFPGTSMGRHVSSAPLWNTTVRWKIGSDGR